MKNSKRPITCLLILLIILCLSIPLWLWVTTNLPAQARRVYGPPARGVDKIELIYLSALLLLQENQLLNPYNPNGSEQTFQVQLGESTYAVTERLQDVGLIGNAEALRHYFIYTGSDTTLQAGEYTLSSAMTPVQIAKALQDPTPREVDFNILPGWRMEEIAALLPTSGLKISSEEFLSATTKPSLTHRLLLGLPEYATLEGFLFPDSYRIPRRTDVDSFVTLLVENFQANITLRVKEGFQQQGLSLYQAVILASIVQREAVMKDEMPTIASVFLNRLAIGMKLDSDPTVQYALGFQPAQKSWWKNPLSLADLKVDSPYNTYLYKGLPPGPISNPSLAALQAVAFPEQTSYYYFRAACDGSGLHLFAETFQQHQSNACR